MADMGMIPPMKRLPKDSLVGWGLLGASGIARTWVAKAIAAQPDSKLVAVVSGSAQRAHAFATEFDIPHETTSLSEFLANPAVDAVYVSTRNDAHHQQVIAAAAAGKHVLCEKPLAIGLAHAIEMVRACESAGLVMGTNHHLRVASTHIAMRRIVRAGGVGQPLAARATWCEYLPEEHQTWRTQDQETGGVIFDLTVHTIDTLRFILGDDPKEVFSMKAASLVGRNNIEDQCQSVFHFSSGLIAQTHEGYAFKNYETAVEVHGTEGSLYGQGIMDEKAVGRVLIRCKGLEEEVPVIHLNPYQETIRQFNSAVKAAGAPAATGWDGVKSLAAALAVKESAASNVSVTIPSFQGS